MRLKLHEALQHILHDSSILLTLTRSSWTHQCSYSAIHILGYIVWRQIDFFRTLLIPTQSCVVLQTITWTILVDGKMTDERLGISRSGSLHDFFTAGQSLPRIIRLLPPLSTLQARILMRNVQLRNFAAYSQRTVRRVHDFLHHFIRVCQTISDGVSENSERLTEYPSYPTGFKPIRTFSLVRLNLQDGFWANPIHSPPAAFLWRKAECYAPYHLLEKQTVNNYGWIYVKASTKLYLDVGNGAEQDKRAPESQYYAGSKTCSLETTEQKEPGQYGW